MQLRPDIQIQSMIKALTEVIIPAIDPSNELAMQQAQLVTGHLVLISTRLPLQYRADRDELQRLLGYAAEVSAKSGLPDSGLNGLIKSGADVLDRARADPAELLSTIRALTESLDVSLRAVFADGDSKTQDELQSITLAMSKAQLLRNRAWLIMQGWEPDPASVPAIESLLPPVPANG